MRLIDADKLKEFPIRRDHYDKKHGNEHFINGIETVLEYADNLPTVDIVRCKDCKYKDKWETNAYGYQWCGVSGLQVVEDISFCSYGERKDGDGV
jgi:hypothetical protein